MKKIVVAALAMLLVVASALCFASCGQKVVEVEVERIVEVEKEVEVPVEVPVEVEVEKATTEINGIAVTGDYALQTKTGVLLITVKYVDMVLNPEFDEELEEDEQNAKYIAGETVLTNTFEVGYTYKALIFGGATYLPATPDEETIVVLNGFYIDDGDAIYTTDADHTIAAAEALDATGIPADTKDTLTTTYAYVTFDFAD